MEERECLVAALRRCGLILRVEFRLAFYCRDATVGSGRKNAEQNNRRHT